MKKIQKKNGKIRIISGYLKGQIIRVINNIHLRPTTHRIRETLFNWIAGNIKNAYCLDCFAGSGALGIESISRYAKYATLLESNAKLVENLKKNIQRLKINNINILHTNTLNWLKKNRKIYDIIFLDPPYQENKLQETAFLLDKNYYIKDQGYIYIEQSKDHPYIQLPKNWHIFKTKKTSTIRYTLYKIHKNIIK